LLNGREDEHARNCKENGGKDRRRSSIGGRGAQDAPDARGKIATVRRWGES
jgi:hypothetical protein